MKCKIPANYGGEPVDFKILEEKEDYIHLEMKFSDNNLVQHTAEEGP